MSVRAGTSPQQRAENVANANYRSLKGEVTRSASARLAASNIRLAHVDLEAAYNQAWHATCQMIAKGERIENLIGLLIDVTYKRSLDIFRQRHEAMHTDADLTSRPVEVDLASQLDDLSTIRRLVERLKDRLNDNERRAVTLCTLHGYQRSEAAQMLGFSEPAFQKVMDSATKKVGAVVAGIQARGCGDDEWASALRAFALGAMSETNRDYERIAAHIEHCPACKRYVLGLRGLAAALAPISWTVEGHEHGGPLSHLTNLPRRLLGIGNTGTAQTVGATQTASMLSTGSLKLAAGILASIALASASIKLTIHSHHPPSHRHTPAATRRTTAPAIIAMPAESHVTRLTQTKAKPPAHHRPRTRDRNGTSPSAPSASGEFPIETSPAAHQPTASQAQTHPAPSRPRTPAENRQPPSEEFSFER